ALQPLRERRPGLGEGDPAVVADAVARREEPREDRAVRGQRGGEGGRRLLEEDAFRGELVEMGCRSPGEAVAAEAIGPERIERDEDDVDGAWRRGEPCEGGPVPGRAAAS